jgi:hypothetical protein
LKSELMLLTVLSFCAVQARGSNSAEHRAGYRTAPRVGRSPGNELPSDSLNCRLIGQFPNRGGSSRYGVGAVVGHLVYLVAGDSGMDILDVSDPFNPSLSGHLHTEGEIQGVDVDGDYAYVAAGHWFQVLDVSDSTNPFEVGYCPVGDWAVGVIKRGDYAYVTDYLNGLRVVNVSKPDSPYVVSLCPSFGAQAIRLSGDYAYVSNAYSDSLDGVRIIDISDPQHPTEVSYFRTYCAEGLDTLGSSHLFVDDGPYMRVLDVSNPADPIQVGYVSGGPYSFGVDVVGDYAYTACDDELRVMDVSDPTDLQVAGYYSPSGSYWRSAVRHGRYVYASEYYSGLQIVEFSGDTTGYGGDEGRRPPARSSQLAATIARGVLWLPAAASSELQAPNWLLDVGGRRVMRIRPGPNDVRRLSPGVYFVSKPRSAEKIVLNR